MAGNQTGIIGIPFIVSAPSGAGKTTLCTMAVDFFGDLRHSISYTTRRPRQGEKNGVDYWFVDDAEFKGMVERGEFLEHADVHGNKYGTSHKDLNAMLKNGVDVMLDIDVQGARNARNLLENGVYIFIAPPSFSVCEERLKHRAKDSIDAISSRLENARAEIKRAIEYEYIIINDALAPAFDCLKSIIIAERAKKQRMLRRIEGLLADF